MDNKEYNTLIENIASLRAEVNGLTRSVDGFRTEVLRMLNDHENRLQRIEKFNAKYEDELVKIDNIEKTTIDNAKVTANTRRFLWAVTTTVGTSLALVIINILISEGVKL